MHTARTLKPNHKSKTEKRKWKTNQSRKHTSSFLFVLFAEGAKEEKKEREWKTLRRRKSELREKMKSERPTKC